MRDGRGVLDGAFRVLRALPDAGPHGQVSRLARMTGIPRPTVHRLLGQLADVGAVEHVDGHYVVASELVRLASRAEPAHTLRRATTGVLEALRETTGATVTLVVGDGDDITVTRVVDGRERLPLETYDGMPLPTTCAAAIVLRPARDPGRLVRARSAVDHGHAMPGMYCYAAPVPLPSGGVAALQVATFGTGPVTPYAPAVHRAARRIAEALRDVSSPGSPAVPR